MSERDDVLAAIGAIEAQRDVLGQAAVDAATGPLRVGIAVADSSTGAVRVGGGGGELTR